MDTAVYQQKPETNACVNEPRHPSLREHPIEWSTREDEPTILRCSYCGSITPQLALALLKEPGTRFSAADWKYGWPHKFYLETPNPHRDKLVVMGAQSGPHIDGTHPDDEWNCFAHGTKECTCPKEQATGYWNRVTKGHRETLHLKFYNSHLSDAGERDFEEFSQLSNAAFGVEWKRDAELRLKWGAVRGAHQYFGTVGPDGKADHSEMRR